MARRRDHFNACVHLTGAPGSPAARARVSGHLVVARHADVNGWASQHFAGALVELAPGTTIYAADVGLLYRLESGGWVEYDGRPAAPELEPPTAPARTRRPGRPPPRPGGNLHAATELLRVITGGR